MPYQLLRLSDDTTPTVKDFVRKHLDMQFHDVHCMLRLPMPAVGLDAGCNFAIASVLLSLVSGLSSWLKNGIHKRGESKECFLELLKNYYPWELQLPTGIKDIERCGQDLYDCFRNQLAHTCGLNERNYQLFISKSRESHSDATLEMLEQSRKSPGTALSYSSVQCSGEEVTRIELFVDNFYWGVREMLERLSADKHQMALLEPQLTPISS